MFFDITNAISKFVAVLQCMCNITPGGSDAREMFSSPLSLSQFTIPTYVICQDEDFFLAGLDLEFESLS